LSTAQKLDQVGVLIRFGAASCTLYWKQDLKNQRIFRALVDSSRSSPRRISLQEYREKLYGEIVKRKKEIRRREKERAGLSRSHGRRSSTK
jgi:hypothetical protein